MKPIQFALSLLGTVGAVVLCCPIVVDAQERPIRASLSALTTSEITAKILVDRGNEKSKQGDLNGAIADYKQALKIKPDYARAYFNLGVTYCELNNPEAEITYYTQAIKYAPNDADSYAERGIARVKLDDRKGAMADLEQALKLNPKQTRAYWGRGQMRQRQQDTQGAVSDFTQSIQLDPAFAPAYFNRGLAYYELGALQENGSNYMQKAVADYTQAIKLDPKFASAYHNRSFASRELGDKQGALADIQKAADIYKQQNMMDNYKQEIEQLEFLKEELATASQQRQ